VTLLLGVVGLLTAVSVWKIVARERPHLTEEERREAAQSRLRRRERQRRLRDSR
jgi:hypothetical protein